MATGRLQSGSLPPSTTLGTGGEPRVLQPVVGANWRGPGPFHSQLVGASHGIEWDLSRLTPELFRTLQRAKSIQTVQVGVELLHQQTPEAGMSGRTSCLSLSLCTCNDSPKEESSRGVCLSATTALKTSILFSPQRNVSWEPKCLTRKVIN